MLGVHLIQLILVIKQVVTLYVDHHILPEVLALRDLARLLPTLHELRSALCAVVLVVVLEGLLVGQLRVDLDQGLLRRLLGRLPHAILLALGRQLPPLVEQAGDRSDAVIGVEQGGHRVEEVLVVLEVRLPLDLL